MGGRGASSGFSKNGKPYGTEYHTVFQSGNIKFVKPVEGSSTAPLETRTRGRVYVTLDYADVPKYISYYDAENKRSKTIDLDHKHNGKKPHVHHGYLHNEKDGKSGATGLNEKEQKMVEKILKIWYSK